MKAKNLLGACLGLSAFLLATFNSLPGLSLAGSIALGIFLLAAIFWILEPIPIYATSMLVILLQVMLLSSQGFVFSVRSAPTVTVKETTGEFDYLVPSSVISSEGLVYQKNADNAIIPLVIERLNIANAEWVTIRSEELDVALPLIADANHRAITGQAYSYSKFYATLASPIIMLFLGGFALAASAVKFGLDKNLTRVLLKPFGSKPSSVCLGLMVCTGALSAFMSNTATTAMMMTVALPIVGSLSPKDPFRKGVALAIPVAANIGGIATPIGTPPNAVALAALRDSGISLSFSSWMIMATPFAAILLLISWRLILSLFKPQTDRFEIAIQGKFQTSPKAIIAYLVFAGTILMWLTEAMHGISTSMVAFIPVALLPAFGVLDKKDIRGFSWEVLWLVAGGISLGLSMKDTGLASWLIGQISWQSFGGVGVVIAFALVGYVLSNLISNTVTATIITPLAITVGATLSVSGDFNLVSGIVAITVIVSCSMVLAISTPPNAIAMSCGIIETKDLARTGLLVGGIGIALAIVMHLIYWPLLM